MTAIDEEVAEQIIGTIRDWVREVIPFAAEYEHADEYPSPSSSR